MYMIEILLSNLQLTDHGLTKAPILCNTYCVKPVHISYSAASLLLHLLSVQESMGFVTKSAPAHFTCYSIDTIFFECNFLKIYFFIEG